MQNVDRGGLAPNSTKWTFSYNKHGKRFKDIKAPV